MSTKVYYALQIVKKVQDLEVYREDLEKLQNEINTYMEECIGEIISCDTKIIASDDTADIYLATVVYKGAY